eukprot:1541309-Rhodomonas_salina.3
MARGDALLGQSARGSWEWRSMSASSSSSSNASWTSRSHPLAHAVCQVQATKEGGLNEHRHSFRQKELDDRSRLDQQFHKCTRFGFKLSCCGWLAWREPLNVDGRVGSEFSSLAVCAALG